MDKLKDQLRELIIKLIEDTKKEDYSWYIKYFNKKNPKLYMTKLVLKLIDDLRNSDYSFINKYNKCIRKEKLKKIYEREN